LPDVSKFESGAYIVRVAYNGKVLEKKVVKEQVSLFAKILWIEMHPYNIEWSLRLYCLRKMFCTTHIRLATNKF
jgi:hypothetical protein